MGTVPPEVPNMRVAVVFSAAMALAAAAPRVSKQAISTPLARGGGRIVGGSDAYHGEFPHQIALLRGGVGGSLMCGGSLVAKDRVITAGHCCDGPSPTTSACWSSAETQTCPAHTLAPLAFPTPERNTLLDPHALSLAGVPPLREAAWEEFCRRLMSLLYLMMTAVTPMDRMISLTP